ncbi:MAG: radical SAM protein [Desulfobacteraceae bacterium]|nr:radical SAM protein [Desulfobacteraceae bacterium]
MKPYVPNYVKARKSGTLAAKIARARKILEKCTLCPRQCKVNRLKGETGVCNTGTKVLVSSFSPHFGEEPFFVGSRGSGTIFFTFCNLGCLFCQNYEISHKGDGRETEPGDIAAMMLALEQAGCHNINLVTPTHVVPWILEALDIAAEQGLSLPLIYNSSGYDSVETLKLLDGVVDIYLPDFKFWESEPARRFCNAPDYPEIAKAAIKEMHAQVGDLKVSPTGTAISGVVLRHLVMPHDLAGTEKVMEFIRDHVSPDMVVNVMSQYRPCYLARRFPDLSRGITTDEFRSAVKIARNMGLTLVT